MLTTIQLPFTPFLVPIILNKENICGGYTFSQVKIHIKGNFNTNFDKKTVIGDLHIMLQQLFPLVKIYKASCEAIISTICCKIAMNFACDTLTVKIDNPEGTISLSWQRGDAYPANLVASTTPPTYVPTRRTGKFS